MKIIPPKVLLFDWGDTLMSEDGPQDFSMADWTDVRALDGAAEVLAELSSRYTLAVATNATVSKQPDIWRALGRVGLDRFIREVFCFTEIGRKKDDPAFWRIVLDRLQVSPAEAVMIGDSLEQDVFGPRKAGVRAIWFNWKNEVLPADDVRVIRHLKELLTMFPNLRDRDLFAAGHTSLIPLGMAPPCQGEPTVPPPSFET
jgi:putative hydrolase of the HAD superfamily